MVIEDIEVFRQIVCRMLVKAGYDVQEAGNGNAGLACYRRQRSDVVITDIVMPDGEGLETIRALRAGDPQVRIIAMSGGDLRQGGNLDLALRFGARRILQKPFTQQELIAAVREVLAEQSKDDDA